eukprot:92961-Hanusia_phi.AAC.2
MDAKSVTMKVWSSFSPAWRLTSECKRFRSRARTRWCIERASEARDKAKGDLRGQANEGTANL